MVFASYPSWAQDDDFEENPQAEELAAPEVSNSESALQGEEEFLQSEPKIEELPVVQEEHETPVDNLVEVQGGDIPLVEVRQRKSTDIPYRDRRETFGWMFSIGAENLFMADYLSLLDDNYYEDLFGDSDISFFQMDLGFKYNFSLGSLALSAGYGMGSITDNRIGDERRLQISKPHLGIDFYLDTLMREPYVVPYAGAQAWMMDIQEESLTTQVQDAITTDVGFSFKVGLLFQLNWLDKDSARDANDDFRIQNTYLDIYAIQNTETQSSDDPNTSSDFNWGAGLKIEF